MTRQKLRMAAYVLPAMQYFGGRRPDDISTEPVYLKTGATKPFAFLLKSSYPRCR